MCKKLLSLFLMVSVLFVELPASSVMNVRELVSAEEVCKTETGKDMLHYENRNKPGLINIAMASDNNYTYPLIVAMTSLVENKNADTKIDFYIMISGDFLPENKAKIMSFQNKYNNCTITLIDMKDKLNDIYTSRHITEASYYRLMLPFLLPNLDKVLYLDSDTIICKDVSDLYNHDLDNYYLAGVLDVCCCGSNMVNVRRRRAETEKDFFIETFGDECYKKQYVNAGVLLFNLSKIRTDKRHIEFIENAKMYNHMYHDQDVLNFVCFGRILILPDVYNKRARFATPNNQAVIHYASKIKPWNTQYRRLSDLWRNYAKKTDYFKEIKKRYLVNSTNKLKSSHSRQDKKHKNVSVNRLS